MPPKGRGTWEEFDECAHNANRLVEDDGRGAELRNPQNAMLYYFFR